MPRTSNDSNGQDEFMGQMFRTKMGADKQSRDMCTEYARDTIEQLWLQWGLEK